MPQPTAREIILSEKQRHLLEAIIRTRAYSDRISTTGAIDIVRSFMGASRLWTKYEWVVSNYCAIA